jgi:Flp pilus assembly pilin Flp
MKFLRALIRDERGQTAVEYMLILAVIVGVIVTLGNTFQSRFKGIVDSVFSKIDRKVKEL